MRTMIDKYIGAEESRMLANFDDMSLVELLVEKGKDAIKDLPKNIQGDKDAVAETIEHNLRKVIIEESPTNPMYFEKMSVLLDELIKMRVVLKNKTYIDLYVRPQTPADKRHEIMNEWYRVQLKKQIPFLHGQIFTRLETNKNRIE
jgi:flagellar biosynthesis component FlhA